MIDLIYRPTGEVLEELEKFKTHIGSSKMTLRLNNNNLSGKKNFIYKECGKNILFIQYYI